MNYNLLDNLLKHASMPDSPFSSMPTIIAAIVFLLMTIDIIYGCYKHRSEIGLSPAIAIGIINPLIISILIFYPSLRKNMDFYMEYRHVLSTNDTQAKNTIKEFPKKYQIAVTCDKVFTNKAAFNDPKVVKLKDAYNNLNRLDINNFNQRNLAKQFIAPLNKNDYQNGGLKITYKYVIDFANDIYNNRQKEPYEKLLKYKPVFYYMKNHHSIYKEFL